MDYGYQLLRHVVRQVFGNLGQAAQLTVTPLIMSLVLSLVIGFVWLLLLQGVSSARSVLVLLGGSGAVVIGLIIAVMYCWAAVGWHRYILLSETGDGLFPPWTFRTVRAYLGKSFLIAIIILSALLVVLFLIGILISVFPSQLASILPGIGVGFVASWLAVRFGLSLPAAALSKRMSLLESWRVSRPVSGHVLLPIIVFTVVFSILGQVNFHFFAVDPGEGILFIRSGPNTAQLGLSGLAVAAGLAWLQLMLNLALLTTLYGNLVEGRALK